MLSTVEKILFLKGVDLFQDMSGEILSHVAQIAEEVFLEKDETVIVEGDIGDALYIILEGEVRIHKDGKQLALITEKEPIGEMGILDSAPRSASVTAKTDARVLKIEREAFNDLLSDHIEIAKGVINVLLRRLRRVTLSTVETTPGEDTKAEEPS